MAMTPEQRRAKDAERKRKARAAAAVKRDAEKAEYRRRPDASIPRTMRDAVETTIAAASKWLVDSDAALVAQARMLARNVDTYLFTCEDSKMLSAQRALTRVLNDLGGTPTVRMQHELRSLKLAAKTEVPDGGEGEAGTQAGNVSEFKRPPKRKQG